MKKDKQFKEQDYIPPNIPDKITDLFKELDDLELEMKKMLDRSNNLELEMKSRS